MSIKVLFAIVLAAAIAWHRRPFGGWTENRRRQLHLRHGQQNRHLRAFSHPLLFPPVNTNANVSIGIDEGCVQILDGPCTNMWTYGGTYPGLTIRRPTGQSTYVTFTNNLGAGAGEMTVHNHGNHSSAA